MLEQYFLAHGLPNDDEMSVLQRATRVDAEIIETWCKVPPLNKMEIRQLNKLQLR